MSANMHSSASTGWIWSALQVTSLDSTYLNHQIQLTLIGNLILIGDGREAVRTTKMPTKATGEKYMYSSFDEWVQNYPYMKDNYECREAFEAGQRVYKMNCDPLVTELRHLAYCANVSLDGLREELKRSELQRDEMLKALVTLELYARDLLLHIDGGKAERTFNLPKEITNAQAVIAKAREKC